MSKNLKITNLFKEKKKSNKRSNMKNTDGLDSEDEKLKEFESHQFINQKIKFKFPKQKPQKAQKTLLDLKKSKEIQDTDSKSTQACSKKYEIILDEYKHSKKNDELCDVDMKDETNHKSQCVFELSSKTKNILNQVLNKKREERQNKISNKENDSTLLLDVDSKNRGKKFFFHDKAQKIN